MLVGRILLIINTLSFLSLLFSFSSFPLSLLLVTTPSLTGRVRGGSVSLHPVAFRPIIAHSLSCHALEVLHNFHRGGHHAAGTSRVEHGGLTFGGKTHVVNHLTLTLLHAKDALDALGELADDFVGERP